LSIGNLLDHAKDRYSLQAPSTKPMTNLVGTLFQLARQRWWLAAAVSSAVCVTVTVACARILESEPARQKRVEHKKRKDLRVRADKIVHYGRTVRRQFPRGAVVVSEQDLAEQLRMRPNSVAAALNVLLDEHKVQRTHLGGYWRLNA
jgi:hypothetical protein